MSPNKSVPTALASILSRFSEIPLLIFYDNACNLAANVNLVLYRVKKLILLLCDRFHYRLQERCTIFDPGIYDKGDKLCTSGAESLNRQPAASRRHMRLSF